MSIQLGEHSSKNVNNIALQRWAILGNALRKNKGSPIEEGSMRKFNSFGILQREELDSLWTRYSYTSDKILYEAQFCEISKDLSPSKLLGFNNTGNVCIWPSEEVLAKYCLDNQDVFSGKHICELGGGMTSLAGVMLSLCNKPKSIFLTDGNIDSVKNIEKIITKNRNQFLCRNVKAGILRWDQPDSFPENKFDYIIAADCLFFNEYRRPLLSCINDLLEPRGVCLLFAPKRGDTFDAFVRLANDCDFRYEVVSEYDTTVARLHFKYKKELNSIYNPDVHYPILIKICKYA